MSPTISPKSGIDHILVNSLSVADEVFGSAWDGSLKVPTKNSTYDAIASLGNASGAYTPTMTPLVNVASVTPFTASYGRVGNYCTVTGTMNVAMTAANTDSQLAISFPIAGALGAQLTCVGGCWNSGVSVPGYIFRDTANDRCILYFKPPFTASNTLTYMFGYQVGTAVAPIPVGSISDAVFSALWNGATTTAPSQNAVFDIFNLQTWDPTILGQGGMTVASVTGSAYYVDLVSWVLFACWKSVTLGGTASHILTLSTPWTNGLNAGSTSYMASGAGMVADTSGSWAVGGGGAGANLVTVSRGTGNAFALGNAQIRYFGMAKKA